MWFPFALSFALITSVSTLIAKRVMKEVDEYVFLFVSAIFTLPTLFLIIIYFYEIPSFDRTFLAATSASVVLGVVAAVFAYRAIRISEISLVSPLSAFNPVFTAIISFFTLGERVGAKGILGILLVCVGAYLLQLSKIRRGWLEPVKALISHKGAQLSVLAYFIWAVTPTFQKVAILHTTPQVPPFASFIGMLGTMFLFGALSKKFSKRKILPVTKKFLRLFILIGVLAGLGQATAFIAFSLGKLGFATAIFKLSMIFTVIFGWLFFKEKKIKERLFGSLIMLVGVYLLAT